MPTPTYRTPVRIARGTYANLNSSIADILEGEVVYATDQDKVYVKEGGVLVSTQADLSGYLTTASASSTYLTQANASSTYLPSATASSTYLTQANASSTYLTQASATSTYLTQANASSTYQTQAGMTGYLATGAIGTTVQAYDANTAKTNAVQSFSAAQRGAVVALTSGATITPDFAAGQNFSLTLGVNATLANPTNLTAGQSGVIVVTQDGTGSRTLAYGSNWKFPGGTAPTLTTTASAVDVIAYYVESATRITARLVADVK